MTAQRRRASNWISPQVARARAILAKYELDRSNPTSDFLPDATSEEEFDKLLKKLS